MTAAGTQDETRAWLDQLLVLLESQDSIVAGLDELAGEQGSCIASGRVDDLLTVLGRRQERVDALLSTQADLVKLTVGLEQRLALVSEDDRERVRALMSHVGERMQSVLDRDARDQQAMEQQREVVRSQLNELDAGRRARRQYLAAAPGGHVQRFADERG
jgi:hypothetical protein